MAKVYADLIRKGLKTLDDVPEKPLKAAVQALVEGDTVDYQSYHKNFCSERDVAEMAVVYATLIVGAGKKTFADVPARIQEQVKQVLIDLDCPELAE